MDGSNILDRVQVMDVMDLPALIICHFQALVTSLSVDILVLKPAMIETGMEEVTCPVVTIHASLGLGSKFGVKGEPEGICVFSWGNSLQSFWHLTIGIASLRGVWDTPVWVFSMSFQ